MRKLISIQFLRAFACLTVLIFHVFQKMDIKPFGNYYLSGGYGVDLFFIISGFLIFITTKENDSWKVFLIKRIFRIFPLYWVAFFLFYILLNTENNFSAFYFLQNLFLIPWNGELTTKSLLVGVAWSTVIEVYFYLVFTVILFFKIKKKYIIALLFSLLILIKVIYYFNPIDINNIEVFNFIYSVAGKTFIIPFIIGIFIGMFYENSRVSTFIFNNKYIFKIFFFKIIILYLILLFFQYKQFNSYLITTIFFSLWLMVDKFANINYNSKISTFFNHIGNISYSIYLLHMLVIELLITLFEIKDVFIVLLLTILITFIISFTTYNFIEKPLINKSKLIVKNIKH
jgi:peptidoglycan/LPS O-acetylase OafA/YrhL